MVQFITMSTAIKATNSRDLKIINCKFQGFETDIELHNVEGFVSQSNTFSNQDPSYLLKELVNTIGNSGLSSTEKKELFQEIIAFYSQGAMDAKAKAKLLSRITNYVGNKAVDFFLQLAAAVVAGHVLIK